MRGLRVIEIGVGLCAALAAGPAWAAESPFIGRWHWNVAESIVPQGDDAPGDVTVEISHADPTRVTWSLTVRSGQDDPTVESYDDPADGEAHPVAGDYSGATATFRLGEGKLYATFAGPTGQTEKLTCTLAADRQTMTCHGVDDDGEGHTANHIDVYDRM